MGNFLGGKMAKITIECENPGKISDGFHSFDELYAHRIFLFISLVKLNKQISWRSRKHDDGTSYDGWFICGMDLPSGTITYHIPDKFWNMLDTIETLEVAKKWDGHTSEDVIRRLNNWAITL